MKKRSIYLICGIILVAAIAALLAFVFSGNNTPANAVFDVTGTWRVVTYVKGETATLIDKEFMVFTDGQAQAYRDGGAEPYASSSYSVDSTMTLEMPEVSKKYTIDKRSDNHIRLYENAETYMYLLRYPNADMGEIAINTAVVTGKWNVVYRDTDSPIADEYLVFENGQMHDYRGNGEAPVATMDYVWDGNQIIISSINKTMTLHIISDTEIAFIETDTGFIWELEKAE